jgi:predicted transcriptional regulator
MAVTITQIEDALEATGGFVSYAAKKLGISQSALSHRIRKSERLQKKREEIQYALLDLTESKLITKIKNEDLGAICFYLKCLGKKRGYIEKANPDVVVTNTQTTSFNYTDELKKRGIPIPEIGISDIEE